MMMTWMVIALAILVAVILFVIIAQGSRVRDESFDRTALEDPELPDWLRDVNDKLGQAVDVYSVDNARKPKNVPSLALAAGIRDLLDEGRKDEAIEVYRKFAGVDQYTAQDAVDEIEREMRLGDDPDGNGLSTAGEVELRDLLLDGRKIEAVKRYRELTGAGLKDAKDVVDEMARGLG